MSTVDVAGARDRTTPEDPSGIEQITHGDPQKTREFRANLAVFARRSEDPEMRKLVAEVLGGRRSVWDVLQAPGFQATVDRHLDNLEAGMERLTDEQRAEVLAPHHTSQATLDRLRDEGLGPVAGDGWAPADAPPRRDPALKHLS